MAIDFTLTPQQRELQFESRRFAADVLSGTSAAEFLHTPEERFLATRPVYEAMVSAGSGSRDKAVPSIASGNDADDRGSNVNSSSWFILNDSERQGPRGSASHRGAGQRSKGGIVRGGSGELRRQGVIDAGQSRATQAAQGDYDTGSGLWVAA